MCHHCVIDSVKERMLSRRGLLRAAAGGTAAAAGAALIPAPKAKAAMAPVEDLTHTLSEDFPTYFGEPGFAMTRKFGFDKDGFNLFDLAINEHTGTHMDAPLHFSADGASVDEIPPGNLVCPLCVIDIREKADADADAQVTPDDIRAWTDANGPIPDLACVAMLSGWGAHVTSDKYRNADSEGRMHFPGFHVEAAQMLLEETEAAGIAVDTLSLDFGPSPDFATHYAWLPAGRWGLECVANLENMPVMGATIVVGAPKHRGGTGGPSRVLGLI